jgi:hypothetical protein
MICENCRANVPKLVESADGRKLCCVHCLFNPLGCRCKFGDLGVVEDYVHFEEEDYPEECSGCGRMEDWCICNEEAY